MANTALDRWFEEVDEIYAELGQVPIDKQLVLHGILRAWLWPLYEMAD